VTPLQKAEDQMRQGYADLAGLYKSNLEAAMVSGQAVISNLQAINGETLAFVQSRIKESLTTSKRLAECTSPEAAIEIQLEFAKAALQSYVDQCSKLGELGSRLVSDSFAPLKQTADAAMARGAKHLAA
jgi:phasin family protein